MTMMWNGYGPSGWGMAMMLVSNLFFLALLLGGGYLLYRAINKAPVHRGADAEEILSQRYARGEIDEDEYKRRLATLHRG